MPIRKIMIFKVLNNFLKIINFESATQVMKLLKGHKIKDFLQDLYHLRTAPTGLATYVNLFSHHYQVKLDVFTLPSK